MDRLKELKKNAAPVDDFEEESDKGDIKNSFLFKKDFPLIHYDIEYF